MSPLDLHPEFDVEHRGRVRGGLAVWCYISDIFTQLYRTTSIVQGTVRSSANPCRGGLQVVSPMYKCMHAWTVLSAEYGSTGYGFPLFPFAPENLVSGDRLGRPVLRQPAHFSSLVLNLVLTSREWYY